MVQLKVHRLLHTFFRFKNADMAAMIVTHTTFPLQRV